MKLSVFCIYPIFNFKSMKSKIGVIFGGTSVEHEISIISALQVINAFDANKYEIIPIYITKEGEWFSGVDLLDIDNYRNIPLLSKKSKRVYMKALNGDHNLYLLNKNFFGRNILVKLDIIFPVFHGGNGEDGAMQGFFEVINIPYFGPNVLSSAIGMDKIIMKKVLNESGLPVIDYTWFYSKDWIKNRKEIKENVAKLKFPVIVKPANLGSSIGILKVNNENELEDAILLAGSFSNRILIEKMVVNLQEINCSVVGDYENSKVSVCEEPIKEGDFLSYEDKYVNNSKGNTKGMTSTQRVIPAKISEELTKTIQTYAMQTFRNLGCAGVSRIDFLIDCNTQNVYVNEINTIPGSLSFYLWEYTNTKFEDLLNDLIELALKAYREKNNLTLTYGSNIFDLKSGSKIKPN